MLNTSPVMHCKKTDLWEQGIVYSSIFSVPINYIEITVNWNKPPWGLIREWGLICQNGFWGRGLIREGGYSGVGAYSIIYGSGRLFIALSISVDTVTNY